MGRLRIVAGELRGRRIRVPEVDGVRPTGDRVREALFSILGEAVVESRILDAYCGSGALGLEALSRGADHAVFVDRDRRCIEVVRRNAEQLGVEGRATFVAGTVVPWMARLPPPGPFDLILADPPYGSREGESFLPAAEAVIAPGGLAVVERSRRADSPQPGAGFELERTARYGESCLDFYRATGPV